MLIVFHTDGDVNRHRKSEGAQYQISKSHIDDKKQTSFTKSLVTFKGNYGEQVSYDGCHGKNTALYHAFCFRKRTSSQMDYSFSGNICRRCVFHRRHFSAEKFETSDALVHLKEDILNCYI